MAAAIAVCSGLQENNVSCDCRYHYIQQSFFENGTCVDCGHLRRQHPPPPLHSTALQTTPEFRKEITYLKERLDQVTMELNNQASETTLVFKSFVKLYYFGSPSTSSLSSQAKAKVESEKKKKADKFRDCILQRDCPKEVLLRGNAWCSLLKCELPSTAIRAAHAAKRSLLHDAEWREQLGMDDNEDEYSPKIGILLALPLDNAYDNAELMFSFDDTNMELVCHLLRRDLKDELLINHCNWQKNLSNEFLATNIVFEHLPNCPAKKLANVTFGDLHGRRLDFRADGIDAVYKRCFWFQALSAQLIALDRGWIKSNEVVLPECYSPQSKVSCMEWVRRHFRTNQISHEDCSFSLNEVATSDE